MARTVADWVTAADGAPPALVYSSADPAVVRAMRNKLRTAQAGPLVEALLADVGRLLLANGFTRFPIVGGETSSAVVSARGVSALQIGPEIDPGVPWTRSVGAPDVTLAQKSGNFGAPISSLRLGPS